MEGGEWNVEQVEALVGIWGEKFDEVYCTVTQAVLDRWMLMEAQ